MSGTKKPSFFVPDIGTSSCERDERWEKKGKKCVVIMWRKMKTKLMRELVSEYILLIKIGEYVHSPKLFG
jgi:hypothetical protein